MTVSEGRKKQIAANQHFKCANKPESNLNKLENYLCPLWKNQDNNGVFDESGYQIDHIIERAEGGSDDPLNLQALCSMCHAVKTNQYTVGRNKIRSFKKENELSKKENELLKRENELLKKENELLKKEIELQEKDIKIMQPKETTYDKKDKNIIELLHCKFEITNNYNDFVTVSEMRKFRDEHRKEFLKMSNKQFNVIIQNVFKISQTRKGKKCTRGWIGLKTKDNKCD